MPARQWKLSLRINFDVIVHFAAETHVDRSIENAAPFLETNILGTQRLLEAAPKIPKHTFHPYQHR